ncbi:hypothetical protein RAD15_15210 [Bradyrhizobium sp. 14AA]
MRLELPSFVLGVLLTTAAASVLALFYAADTKQIWDVLKLAVQGIGALIIARLAVVWAVETFKSQKSWERDATTFSNLLAALREMHRANDILWDDVVHAKDYTEKYLEEVKGRWSTAKKKFEDAAAASIFLPREISSVILQLEADLANAHYDSYQEHIDGDGYMVSEALKKLERLKHLI